MDYIVINKIKDAQLQYNKLTEELNAGLTSVEKLKEYNRLSNIINLSEKYYSVEKDKIEMRDLIALSDSEEFKKMCEEEHVRLEEEAKQLELELEDVFSEKEPDDGKNAIFEISGEVGGEEANLFARDLFQMYVSYAEKNGFTVDLLGAEKSKLSGYNYVSFKVIGYGAYGKFKYESGIHRVQRVPETEQRGRIHTSTASVLVVPETSIEEFELNLEDVEITTCHASGAGGQHINKTSSAVRAIYKPTGLTVFCQSRRSQLQNKEEALRILASKLKAEKTNLEASKASENKSSVLGTRDRSEKIRTYNYPENRLTDHRINYKTALDKILSGDLEELFKNLRINK